MDPKPLISDAASPSGQRLTLLQDWLRSLAQRWSLDPDSLAPASSDASFRRYFRVRAAYPDHATLIVMDAPPEHEDCRPFIRIAQMLREAGVRAPAVLEQDLQRGLLLLSDLGDTTFLRALREADGETRADVLYRAAGRTLVTMQAGIDASTLPPYDEALLSREMQLFDDWYLARHLQVTLSDAERAALARVKRAVLDNVLAQPAVFVHRDYHSRNLMAGHAVDGEIEPGVLDFQDAVRGPITYDAVSLWRDAYIVWDEARQIDWLARYWSDAKRAGLPVSADFGAFYRDFDWMGMQRQLKVLGIFARLAYRDGKTAYLDDLPVVLAYVRTAAARYAELAPLARLFDRLDPVKPQTGYTF